MLKISSMLCCCVWLMPALAARAETAAALGKTRSELVAAEVNSVRITHEQVDREMQRRFATQQRVLEQEHHHLLRKHVLKLMIERELLRQAAVSSGIIIPDPDLEAALKAFEERLRQGESSSRLLWAARLDKDDLRRMLLNDLLVKRYLETNVYGGINVTEDDARARYEREPERYRVPLELRARHILFQLDEDADEAQLEEARARATKVLQAARRNGESFEELAKKFSEGPTRAKGGDLGYFTYNQMVPAFAQAAFALQPGEISDIVRTPFGLHIIQAVDLRGGTIPPFPSLAPSIKAQLEAERRRELLKQQLELLKNASKVIQYIN